MIDFFRPPCNNDETMRKYKTVIVKCLVDQEDAENNRAEIFAACQDLGISVLESDTYESSRDELEMARNIGIIDE